MTTRKEPSGGKHGPCTTHVPHPYTSNGWLCVDDEPGRAEAMVELADHLASIAARHHETELERRAIPADGTHARWHEPIGIDPASGLPIVPGGVCGMKNGRNGPRAYCGGTIHLHTMGGPAVRSTCAGHTCGPKVAPVVETPAPVVRARKVGPRHVHATAEGGAVFAGDTCATCGTTIPRQDPAYAAGVQESRVLSSAPFALPDPIVPADALAGFARDMIDTGRALGILAGPLETATRDNGGAGTYCTHRIIPAGSLVEPIPARRAALVVVRDGRPYCARCGQTFRKNGTGTEWHRVNRPDCRAEQRASA